jgi:hypothetical protein
MPKSLRVVIEERHDGAPQRHDGHGGGRFESGNQANEIAEQNEERQRHQKRRVPLAVRADDFLALLLDKADQAFKRMLQGAGAIDRKPGPNDEEDDDQKEADHDLHGNRIHDRCLGMAWMKAHRFQHRGNRLGQQAIEDFCKPELLHRNSVVSR